MERNRSNMGEALFRRSVFPDNVCIRIDSRSLQRWKYSVAGYVAVFLYAVRDDANAPLAVYDEVFTHGTAGGIWRESRIVGLARKRLILKLQDL